MTSIKLSTTTEICALLGARARQLRLVQNLTQAELAARAGVSFNAVRKLETSGQTTLTTFISCVQALGAESDLEPVLAPRLQSIAEMERHEQATQRQRARRSRRAASTQTATTA
jgi:transcriptional regulator with XRE-family HTH domain